MSKIDKLSIQGIRSYGPEDPRIIKFYTPLTLILGQNGCGKTTIIECLKYISTGDVPPGCGKGGSFVHDPKMADEISVRGQIKLKFSDVRGEEVVTTRILEATQKAKKLESKTIDATMTRKRHGQVTSISSKCLDFEAEMITCLGVSKPILNNVIFCHQEDSNWPLDEGQKVKEKFDAIFNATKYIKCLNSVKKQRAEMKSDVKSMKELLVELKKLRDEAGNKRRDQDECNRTKASIQATRATLTRDMARVHARLKEVQDLEMTINKLWGDLNGKELQLQSVREVQSDLRDKLTDQIDCSDQELHRLISNFEAEVERKERQLAQVRGRLDDTGRGQRDNAGRVTRAQREVTVLEEDHKRHLAQLQQRNTLAQRAAQDHALHEYRGRLEYSDRDVSEVLAQLNKVIEDELHKIKQKKDEFEQKEHSIQQDIDALRSQEAALEHEVKSKTGQLNETHEQLRSARQQLTRHESDLSSTSLDALTADIRALDQEIEREEEKVDINKLTCELEGARTRSREVGVRLDEARRAVKAMHRQAAARSEYELRLKNKKELEDKMQFLRRKCADELEHLLGEAPEDNVKHRFDARRTEMKQSINTLTREVEQLKKQKTRLDTQLTGEKQNQQKKDEEIKELEGKISRMCQGTNLERALDKSKKLKDNLGREKGELNSSMTVFKTFTEKLRRDDCCPLCLRDFINKDESIQLIEDLERKVSNIPGRLEEVRRKLETEEKSYDQLVQLKPQQDRANTARQELGALSTRINKATEELESVNLQLEEKEEVLALVRADEEMAQGLQPDVITLDQHAKTLRTLNDNIEKAQAALGDVDTGMTLEEMMEKEGSLENEMKDAQAEVEATQVRLQDHKDLLQSMRDRRLHLSQRELELKTKLQETDKLKDNIDKLESEKIQLSHAIQKAKGEVGPLKPRISSSTREKMQVQREKEEWVADQNNRVGTIRDSHRELSRVTEGVEEYRCQGGEQRLKKSHGEVSRLKEEAAELEERKNKLEAEKEVVQEELSNQNQRKRSLEDEKTIRKKEVEAKQLEGEIDTLKHRIKEFDFEKVADEKKQLLSEGHRMNQEDANMDGRLSEIEKRLKELDISLRNKAFRDAEKNYKEKLVEMKVTDTAADDLAKYYKALDTCIMRYHADRMQAINAIIRELWRSTYRGNDIDYIEIKTDETESQGIEKRKVCHYRVVMVKNNVEMDMRGRCSAGQKVLASLIIRMALSETFSSNCGILALDEPTTNLDRENIQALAVALLDIVQKRYVQNQQKKFQLIIITHDTDFLERLGHSEFIDFYSLVDRNHQGLSTITPKSITQL